MRFRCPFCLSLLESSAASGAPLECQSCGRKTFVPKSPFEPNCVIDDFVIREKIGKGSIGTVYKAVQLSLEREVALKILAPELTNPKVAASFLHEARAAANLSHVNLVQSFAIGEENGICFMAMNYINGESLSSKLSREGRIPVDEALHIAQQVAEALYYAWNEAKLIHRDVKPDNIMITAEGVVKLTDLGLAINQAECADEQEICGSPSYMSPEQFAGEQLDSRSDIYSLGITLYEMLSGELPFKAETFQNVARQHFNDAAAPLHRLGLGISLRVSSLVKKMMEKLPDYRFGDMEALLKEIWRIRQTTAPDKHLVPNVHTISIARLDYQLQNQAAQTQEALSAAPPSDSSVRKLKNRRDWLFWSMATISPIPFVILLGAVIVHALNREPAETAIIEEKVSELEKKLNNPGIPPTALSVEFIRLMTMFADERSQKQEALFWKLKTLIAGIDFAKKELELEEKINYAKSLEAQLKELHSAKTGNDSKLAAEIKKSEERSKIAERELAGMSIKIKELESKIHGQSKQAAELTVDASRRLTAYEKLWKTDILNDLYRQFKAGDYVRAEAFLTYKRSAYGKEQCAWFNSYIDWIKHLRELEEYFNSGGSGGVGKIINGRKITMISCGNIYFEERNGMVKSKAWHDFSPQGIYELLQKARPELVGKRKIFDADLACVKDGIFSQDAINGRPCLKELCQALIDSSLENIMVISAYDKSRAAADADSLLNMLKNTEFALVVREKLGTLGDQN